MNVDRKFVLHTTFEGQDDHMISCHAHIAASPNLHVPPLKADAVASSAFPDLSIRRSNFGSEFLRFYLVSPLDSRMQAVV